MTTELIFAETVSWFSTSAAQEFFEEEQRGHWESIRWMHFKYIFHI
jgi:hypothetical protein